jgi:phage/plasmid-associated DNA primase
VTDATASYREESDPLGEFLMASCVLGDGLFAGASAAYQAYRAWAAKEGLSDKEAMTSTAFGKRMTARFRKHSRNSGKVYLGIGLLPARDDAPLSADRVTGSVTGPEGGTRGSEVLHPVDSDTREDVAEPVTTRHPSQTPTTSARPAGAPQGNRGG